MPDFNLFPLVSPAVPHGSRLISLQVVALPLTLTQAHAVPGRPSATAEAAAAEAQAAAHSP